MKAHKSELNRISPRAAVDALYRGDISLFSQALDQAMMATERKAREFRESFTEAQVLTIAKAEKLGWYVKSKNIENGAVYLTNDRTQGKFTMTVAADGVMTR